MTEKAPTKGESPWNQRARLIGLGLALVIVGLFAANVSSALFLCDDAFISFRYAWHFAEGNGLVWNVGERVEGYSNFLWVVLLGVFKKMGVQPELSSIVFSITSGLLLLGALVVFSARRYGRTSLLTWFAPLALAASPSFTAWCSGGLETMMYALLIFIGTASLLEARGMGPDREWRWILASSLLFAVANLTRPDAPLFAGLTALFFFGEKILRDRRLPVRAALVWTLPYGAIVAAHFLWRHAYYGDWLPNTYYAKVNESWWEQGVKYLDLFADNYSIYYLLPLLALALLWRPRFESLLFVTVIGAWSTYVAKIGGDWMENRMLVVLYPALYWLIGEGLARLSGLPVAKPRLAKGLGALTAVLALVIVGLTYRGNRTEVLMKYMGTGDELSKEEMIARKVASVNALRFYAFMRSQQGTFLRSLVDDGLLPEDLVLGVSGAGALPYYTMWPAVDVLGLTDAHVARQSPSDETKQVVVGHEHWASVDYLRERGVVMLDALNQIVFDEPYDPDNDPFAPLRTMVHPLPDLKFRTVKVRDKYLVFATLVSEEEFQRIFDHLEVLE